MENTLISKLTNRAIDTASLMNAQAKGADIARNHVNYGALSEICYILCQIGIPTEQCTYRDGEVLICASIKQNGKTLISFEK